ADHRVVILFSDGGRGYCGVDFFPTRRSSELDAVLMFTTPDGAAGAALAAGAGARCACALADSAGTSSDTIKANGRSWTYARATRSEEHTSELQSRDNLVCRLLLGKDNRIALP